MSATMRMGSPRLGTTEVEALRGTGLFLVVMGVALIIVGFAAIGSAFIATFTTVLVFGIFTSIFTSLMGSRALVQVIYGGRRKVERLSI